MTVKYTLLTVKDPASPHDKEPADDKTSTIDGERPSADSGRLGDHTERPLDTGDISTTDNENLPMTLKDPLLRMKDSLTNT